jgi:hypothetical protein
VAPKEAALYAGKGFWHSTPFAQQDQFLAPFLNPKQSSQLRLSQIAISSAAPCNFTLDFRINSHTIADSSSVLRLAARRLVTLTSQKGIFEMRLSALEAALGRASHSLLVSLVAV